MALQQPIGKRVGMTALAWAVAFVIFFPILWTFLTSFKSEGDASSIPPQFLFFHWTTENYREIFNSTASQYIPAAINSIIICLGANLVGLIVGVPAAWSMAFAPTRRTKDILLWMLSTKMMPAVGALMPVLFIFQMFGLIDTRLGIGFILFIGDLPILIWMLYTYFKEIPVDILEAARMDGCTLTNEIIYILTPMAVPGIASTMLIAIILSWNEAFWTLNLTAVKAAPLTFFISTYSTHQGAFFASLSAASMLAIAPIMILGWFSQKQLVRGLTFGAVK
jgi:sorbitol/mannitol transport system permease protein